MARGTNRALVIARTATQLAFAVVFFFNVRCALEFMLTPAASAASFGLSGVSGQAAIAGMGVAFLMWNATYPAVIANPERFGALAWVVLAQQVIGLVGESIIYLGIPSTGHALLMQNVGLFIRFDLFGLIIMGVTFGALVTLGRAKRRSAA